MPSINSTYNPVSKPASDLVADRLANKLKSSDNSGGESPLLFWSLLDNTQGGSSHQPRQQSSGESPKQTPSSSLAPGKYPVIYTLAQSTATAESSLTASLLPPSEVGVNSTGATDMSSDDESPKPNRKSRSRRRNSGSKSSDDESPKEPTKSRRRNSSVDSDSGGKKKKSSKRDGDRKKKKCESDDDARSGKMKKSRDVSFSGSTIERIEQKQSLEESSGSLLDKPALKPGKYSRGGSFEGGGDNGGAKMSRKISFGEVVSEATKANPVTPSADDAAAERRKLMFARAVDMRNSLEPTEKKTTFLEKKPTLNGSASNSLSVRRASEPDRLDKLDKEEADWAPPAFLQRRASAPQLVKRKSLTQVPINSSGLTPAKGKFGVGATEAKRRSAMSRDDQLYVPPKVRDSGFVQALAHLMAGRITDLVLWTYGASFAKVMFFFLAVYVFNIFLWAFVIIWADTVGASGYSCLYGEGGEFYTTLERYELGFELSWCTFTTVGYGAISPPGDDTNCYPLRLVCALVAFIGVLFGSTTAAIMYSKLMRLLAKAQVTFSSTLCVQFGKGNEGSTVRFGQLNFKASVVASKFDINLLNSDSDDDEKPAGSDDGYPVIEFRMVNDRANHERSEIWDASISGVVQLFKEEQPKDGAPLKASAKATGGESTLDLEKVVYYPVTLTPDSHPHFSRIWYARHVLNAESPLLKREFRDMIAQDGKWDEDFNSWREIRDCLNPFVSLRITLSGTSAVSAATVYGEHVYEFEDVCVGWRFANMVYEDKPKLKRWWHSLFGEEDDKKKTQHPDLATKVDMALLHDIVPQPGGGHEPLEEDHSVHSMRRKILGHSGMKRND